MKPENLNCPDCDGPMVSRLNKSNQSRFWGCAKFPECRGTRDVNGLSKHDIDNIDPDYDLDPIRWDR